MLPYTVLIDTLENAPQLVVGLVREAPVEILKLRPAPGEWSIHESACHLASVHPLFFHRLELMLSENHPTIKPYNPGVDDAEDALLAMDLEGCLAQFVSERERLVRRLKELAPQDWERSAAHPEYARYSVFIMFRHLLLHDQMHAYHIEELVLKPNW